MITRERDLDLKIDDFRERYNIEALERILPFDEMIKLLNELRGGFFIGVTTGSFDLLHSGHVRYLENLIEETAKRSKQVHKEPLLLVGINSDESTRRNKGFRTNGRPVQDEKTRAEIIAGLRGIDFSFIFDDDLQLTKLNPDVFQVFTGSEHKPEERPEVAYMLEHGTEIVIMEQEENRPGATTDIIAKIKNLDIY